MLCEEIFRLLDDHRSLEHQSEQVNDLHHDGMQSLYSACLTSLTNDEVTHGHIDRTG